MKDILKKKLEEVKKEEAGHIQNLQQLETAHIKCSAIINSIKGKIQVLEELLK